MNEFIKCWAARPPKELKENWEGKEKQFSVPLLRVLAAGYEWVEKVRQAHVRSNRRYKVKCQVLQICVGERW